VSPLFKLALGVIALVVAVVWAAIYLINFAVEGFRS